MRRCSLRVDAARLTTRLRAGRHPAGRGGDSFATSRALRKTLKLDNGFEFNSCPQWAEKLSLGIYYADPYAACQRGANEQANGLLQRFFPKKTDFAQVTLRQVRRAAELINHLPRKCLQYKTPHEVFWKAVAQARQQSSARQ